MRGALTVHGLLGVHDGIIPADAGSTSPDDTYRGEGKDHPRGCGEHWGTRWVMMAWIGSSPRMRGARCCAISQRVDGGIIPADAGSTLCMSLKMHLKKDHPRGCGEHISPACANIRDMGSSPRMRGARLIPSV